ncbi:MAG: hypothetical protein E7K48_03950, partial [Varibaculum cambriense]|nr:hypothetical protein [Varibaculum cambriense]
FRRSALFKVGPLSDFDTAIVDRDTPDWAHTELKDSGLEVLVAEYYALPIEKFPPATGSCRRKPIY